MSSNGETSVTMQRYAIALSILQKIASSASTIGCLMIISQVTRSKVNRTMTQQRIILGTSIANLLPSVILLFQDLYYPGEIGTLPLITTPACTAGGFLLQFGSVIGVIYAASMQVQYVLVIKYGWKDKRMRKLEPWLHLVPILFGLGTSIPGLVLKLYNPADWNCWIAPFPYNCTTTYWVNHVEPSMGKTDCVRGDNYNFYRFAFFYIPLWVTYIFSIISLFLVYQTVRNKELKTRQMAAKFIKEKKMLPKLTMANTVKRQAMAYAISFLVVWIFPTIARVWQLVSWQYDDHPPILAVLSAFSGSSSIGYFNAATYFWPRYRKLREKHTRLQTLWSILHSTLFFWTDPCCQNNCKSNDYTKDSHDSVIYTERDIPTNFMVEEEKREEELEDTSAVDATTPTP